MSHTDPMSSERPITVRQVAAGPDVRRSVRVLLVDRADRVLLLRLAAPVDGLPLWIAPGGGIEPGEEPADAAVRELREELGVRLDRWELTGPVWVQELNIEFGTHTGIDNTYLFARVDVVRTCLPRPPNGRLRASPRSRAGTPGGCAAAGRVLFSPRALADMLDAVLANGVPQTPLQVGT